VNKAIKEEKFTQSYILFFEFCHDATSLVINIMGVIVL